MNTHPHILIFKTNIATTADRSKVSPILDQQSFIHEWTVDMQDIDCVLRVVASEPVTQHIISLIQSCGCECAELED